MLLLLRFFRNSEVAIRVVSTRRESNKSFCAASLFKVKKKKFLVSNKELKRKQVLFQKLLGLG